MKALSVRQPWAWAILHAGKRHENRSWKTNYRGPLLIHASLKADDEAAWSFVEDRCEALRPNSIFILPRKSVDYGGIVGVVDVIDCVSESNSPWFFGPHALVLANPRPCEFLPWKGRLGLFDVPDELIKVLA